MRTVALLQGAHECIPFPNHVCSPREKYNLRHFYLKALLNVKSLILIRKFPNVGVERKVLISETQGTNAFTYEEEKKWTNKEAVP